MYSSEIFALEGEAVDHVGCLIIAPQFIYVRLSVIFTILLWVVVERVCHRVIGDVERADITGVAALVVYSEVAIHIGKVPTIDLNVFCPLKETHSNGTTSYTAEASSRWTRLITKVYFEVSPLAGTASKACASNQRNLSWEVILNDCE